ncbi:uncharacterized protein TrAFT101_006439 [Trichoderma asperellum]|uniref:uncharacterized protein n=1 Tax=Trichoderma asperellum TaxID=101201 RepID=UPI00331C9451|nr:hypothetical protein TrAFT101_006439 [Trichoderma asperellum]
MKYESLGLLVGVASGLAESRQAARQLPLTTTTAAAATPWPSVSYKTEPFTSPELEVNQTGPTAPGLIWFSPALFFPQQGPGAPSTSELTPLIASQNGEVVFHGPNYPPDQPNFFANFRPQFFSNGTLLSYYLGHFGPNMEQALGNVTFIDSTYTVTTVICLADYPAFIPGAAESECKVDLHESRRLSDDRFIVTTHNYTQTDLSAVGGPQDGWVTDSQFLVINPFTEEISFKWSSLEHLDKLPVNDSRILRQNRMGQELGTSPELAWDYFHINAVAPFEDGYVISARHFSTVVFIDKDGEVTYRLNGEIGQDFSLPTDAHFRYQHDVLGHKGDDGSIIVTMFDNENYDVPPPSQDVESSALELRLNTNDMTAKLERRLFSNDTVRAIGLGSWQDQPNGNVFVGEATFPALAEFDPTGKQVWNLRYGFDSPGSFRAYKYTEWTGKPAYPPKGVAEAHDNGSLVVFMSWNGATEVVSWDVKALTDNGISLKLTNVPKSGFETTAIVNATTSQILLAVALGDDGQVLGTSEPFSA